MFTNDLTVYNIRLKLVHIEAKLDFSKNVETSTLVEVCQSKGGKSRLCVYQQVLSMIRSWKKSTVFPRQELNVFHWENLMFFNCGETQVFFTLKKLKVFFTLKKLKVFFTLKKLKVFFNWDKFFDLSIDVKSLHWWFALGFIFHCMPHKMTYIWSLKVWIHWRVIFQQWLF